MKSELRTKLEKIVADYNLTGVASIPAVLGSYQSGYVAAYEDFIRRLEIILKDTKPIE